MNSRLDKLVKYGGIAVAVLGFVAGFGLLFRPVWFDEALTIGTVNLCGADGAGAIYRAYDIPNNHIVFSISLHYWLELVRGLTASMPVFLFRVPSLIFGLAGLAALYRIIAKRAGKTAATSVLLPFAASATFAVYATAVRGYMLGFLLTVAAYGAAEYFVRKGGIRYGVIFAVLCYLSVGTAPSNLAALIGIGIMLTPAVLNHVSGRDAWDRIRTRRLAMVYGIPLAMLAAFYLPILPKFLHCAGLGEGWSSPGAAAWGLYGTWILIAAAGIVYALRGAWEYGGKHEAGANARGLALLTAACVFLLPLPAFLVFKAPAFPRVFVPLLPLWLILTAQGIRLDLKRHPHSMVLAAAGGWTVVSILAATQLSTGFFGPDGRNDDMYLPQYARSTEYRPDAVIQELGRKIEADGDVFSVFATFAADYPALYFYASSVMGDRIPQGTLLFDPPNRPKRQELPEGRRLLIIARDRADMESTLQRFGLTSARAIYTTEAQTLYEAER